MGLLVGRLVSKQLNWQSLLAGGLPEANKWAHWPYAGRSIAGIRSCRAILSRDGESSTSIHLDGGMLEGRTEGKWGGMLRFTQTNGQHDVPMEGCRSGIVARELPASSGGTGCVTSRHVPQCLPVTATCCLTKCNILSVATSSVWQHPGQVCQRAGQCGYIYVLIR